MSSKVRARQSSSSTGMERTDARTWEAQVIPFATCWRVVAYSRRYHYPNAWVNGTPGLNSTQVHADDLYGLIRNLGLPPVHLVASSYGGDIALLVALQHPDVVRSLALGEPGLAHWLLQFADGPELSAIRERLWATFQPAAQRGDLEVAARRYAQVVLSVSRFEALPTSIQQRVLDNARLLGAA
jgi:non-heme chloroperoxidase